jgi:hypothetical protein
VSRKEKEWEEGSCEKGAGLENHKNGCVCLRMKRLEEREKKEKTGKEGGGKSFSSFTKFWICFWVNCTQKPVV